MNQRDKTLLVGQSKNSDSPFSILDRSVKQELSGDWKEKVRNRIKNEHIGHGYLSTTQI